MTDSEKLKIAINLINALNAIIKSYMEDDEDIKWAEMVYLTDIITCTLEQIKGTPCETPNP